MKRTILLIFASALLLSLNSCYEVKPTKEPGFSFCFLTDIHLQPERNAVAGFQKTIAKTNSLNPDFVITGGDLIMDALGQSYGRSDSLFNLYIENQKRFKMPVHNTLGNHEVYGWYDKSKADSLHPEYGEKMFDKRIGERHYSFDHKGWHFIIFDSVEEHENGNAYIGQIDSAQMAWLASDLAQVDRTTPIVVATHIPLITAQTQMEYGSLATSKRSWVVNNTKEVLQLFEGHDLKLILQGHLHIFEDIYIYGKHFVTGGAVCGAWWTGPYKGSEEGFVKVTTIGNDFELEYVDYGWEVALFDTPY